MPVADAIQVQYVFTRQTPYGPFTDALYTTYAQLQESAVVYSQGGD